MNALGRPECSEATDELVAEAGILWVVSALLATGITLIIRIDPVQVLVTIAASAVAAVLGLWMIARLSTTTVPLSNVVGVAWLVLYAAHRSAVWRASGVDHRRLPRASGRARPSRVGRSELTAPALLRR